MQNRFFITGLPRTRSAWFAAFFSAFPIRCFHDGFMGCESVAEYFGKIDGAEYSATGDAGSGIPLIWRQIVEHYENPPIVLIERDIKPVLDFGRKVGTLDWVLPLQESIADMEENYPDILKVHFKDINERLPEIWNYCVGDHSIDNHRVNLYCQMNIQTDLGRYIDPVNLQQMKEFLEKI